MLYSVNKKLWSFNVGFIMASSFVWLVSFGQNAPLLDGFQSLPYSLLPYYAELITAVASFVTTALLLVLMKKLFDISCNDHTFWLMLPSAGFIVLTYLGASIMLTSVLFAAIPALTLIVLLALFHRLSKANLNSMVAAPVLQKSISL